MFEGHKISLESSVSMECKELAGISRLQKVDCFILTFKWTDRDHLKQIQNWVVECRKLEARCVIVLVGDSFDSIDISKREKCFQGVSKLMTNSLRIPQKNLVSLPIKNPYESINSIIKNIIKQRKAIEDNQKTIFNPLNDSTWSFVVI